MRLPKLATCCLLAVATAVATLVTTSSPAVGAAAPTLKWERSLPGHVVESSPTAVDLDGDGGKDVVVGSHDTNVYALQGADGADVRGWPRRTTHRVDSSASTADVNGDGRPELFIGSGFHGVQQGALYSFDAGGGVRFRFVARDNDYDSPAIHSTPALGDVNANGVMDASFGALAVKSIWSVDVNGNPNPGFPFYADDTVFSAPALADATGDGVPEIIIGGDSAIGGPVDHRGGLVRAISGDGRQFWEFRVDDIARGGPSVGDIDGDGRAEVVFGGGDFYGGADSVKVFALDLATGRLKPGWPQVTDGVTNASPTLADVDGNGRLDVITGTWNSTHGRGRGESVWVWDGAGARLPGFPRPSGNGVVLGSITTADLNSDGAQDLLVPTASGVHAFDGRGGAKLFDLAVGLASFQSSPLVADLDGNGLLDIVIAGGRPNGPGFAYRYELGPEARLGALGWHQFRKDDRKTGSWTTPSAPVARDANDACPPGRVPEDGFSDVVAGSTHEAAVDCLAWWRVAQGSAAGYVPARPVTRDQMATFIANLILRSGGTLPSGSLDRFPDDERAAPHEDNINRLAEAGIVSGRNGAYAPDEVVTRGQMASFLVRAYEYRAAAPLPAGRDAFPDDVGSSHEATINKAAAAGFTGGTAGGGYVPLGAVARDQMASFLVRVLDLFVEERRATLPSGS